MDPAIRLQITEVGKEPKLVPVGEITRKYADRVCQGYGWAIGSAAHGDLASPWGACEAFVLQEAQTQFPNSSIQLVKP